MSSDAELKSQFNSYKAQKEKYEKVKNSISSNNLDYTRSISEMTNFLTYCNGIISTINDEPGYHYLSNFSSKLEGDVKIMKKYADFVQDANTSFKNLYTTLESKISTLDSKMDAIRDEYNEGKSWLERNVTNRL